MCDCRKEPVLKEKIKIKEREELTEGTRFLFPEEVREVGWDKMSTEGGGPEKGQPLPSKGDGKARRSLTRQSLRKWRKKEERK